MKMKYICPRCNREFWLIEHNSDLGETTAICGSCKYSAILENLFRIKSKKVVKNVLETKEG